MHRDLISKTYVFDIIVSTVDHQPAELKGRCKLLVLQSLSSGTCYNRQEEEDAERT